MPDRAIIPFMPAVALGFTCGLVCSVLLLNDTPTLVIGIVGAVMVAIAGTSSVFGCKGDTGEKVIVGALRALTAVALFGCVMLFMLGFLREGQPFKSLIWLPLAGLFGILLARQTVRERKPVEDGEGEDGEGRKPHRGRFHRTEDGNLRRDHTDRERELDKGGSDEKGEKRDNDDDRESEDSDREREKSTA